MATLIPKNDSFSPADRFPDACFFKQSGAATQKETHALCILCHLRKITYLYTEILKTMGKRNRRARFSKSKNKLYQKTRHTPSPRRNSYRSLNPYVMRMDRIRADEVQLQFWNRFGYLKQQGLIPQWLCVCKEGRYLSCSSCGIERNCRSFPIKPSTLQVKCKCGKNPTDEWHCPPCLKRLERQKNPRRKRSTYWRRLPGSITQ